MEDPSFPQDDNFLRRRGRFCPSLLTKPPKPAIFRFRIVFENVVFFHPLGLKR